MADTKDELTNAIGRVATSDEDMNALMSIDWSGEFLGPCAFAHVRTTKEHIIRLFLAQHYNMPVLVDDAFIDNADQRAGFIRLVRSLDVADEKKARHAHIRTSDIKTEIGQISNDARASKQIEFRSIHGVKRRNVPASVIQTMYPHPPDLTPAQSRKWLLVMPDLLRRAVGKAKMDVIDDINDWFNIADDIGRMHNAYLQVAQRIADDRIAGCMVGWKKTLLPAR